MWLPCDTHCRWEEICSRWGIRQRKWKWMTACSTKLSKVKLNCTVMCYKCRPIRIRIPWTWLWNALCQVTKSEFEYLSLAAAAAETVQIMDRQFLGFRRKKAKGGGTSCMTIQHVSLSEKLKSEAIRMHAHFAFHRHRKKSASTATTSVRISTAQFRNPTKYFRFVIIDLVW